MQRFEVARLTARKAVRVLADEGLVEVSPAAASTSPRANSPHPVRRKSAKLPHRANAYHRKQTVNRQLISMTALTAADGRTGA